MTKIIYQFQIKGEKINKPVFIEVTGVSKLQAIFKAKEEANRLNLKWDTIEII